MLNCKEEHGEEDIRHEHHIFVEFEAHWFEVVLEGARFGLELHILCRTCISDRCHLVFHLEKLIFKFPQPWDLILETVDDTVNYKGKQQGDKEFL